MNTDGIITFWFQPSHGRVGTSKHKSSLNIASVIVSGPWRLSSLDKDLWGFVSLVVRALTNLADHLGLATV